MRMPDDRCQSFALNIMCIANIGSPASPIQHNCLNGIGIPKFGSLIIALNKKNKKLENNTAIPTPFNPHIGTKYNVNNTFDRPDMSLIIKVIQVLFAKWYCNVV